MADTACSEPIAKSARLAPLRASASVSDDGLLARFSHDPTNMTGAQIQGLNSQLNDMIVRGQALDAFERFYADDVVMQENLGPPIHGKDANRVRAATFLGSIKELHVGRIVQGAVGDDVSFAEMEFDAILADGKRVHITEVARRQWKDGKIVHERFYYAPQDDSVRAAMKEQWPAAMQDLHELRDRLELKIHLGGMEVQSAWKELVTKIDGLAGRFAQRTESKLDDLEARAKSLIGGAPG